jgi:hypothetical protein
MSADSCNEETLAMAAGALLSLAFSYIPGLQERYAARILYDLVDRSLAWLTKCAQPLFVSSFFIFVLFVFLIREWFPSRMSFRIRLIHEKHR